MKYRIRIIPEVDYTLKDLFKAIALALSLILLSLYFYDLFAILVKAARKWWEINCQNIDIQHLIHVDFSKVSSHILDALSIIDTLIDQILLFLLLSSFIKKRIRQKGNTQSTYSAFEGVFVLCHLRRPRE